MEQNSKKKKDLIDKITSKLASMESDLKTFEASYEEVRSKAESEAVSAAKRTSNVRVPVTK